MSTHENRWATNVNDLLATFRMALVALVPAMDAARIPWRNEHAYDDWDDIAATLFRNIVERSLQHAREITALVRLPMYGTLLPSYRNCPAVIMCHGMTQPSGLGLVFVGLSTRDTPFDAITCARTDFEHSQAGVISIPFAQCDFAYVSAPGHGGEEVRSLTVEL